VVIEIEPPQEHMQVLSLVSAGLPPTVTLLDPGDHGAVVTGMHGCGVSTPMAAEVAAATCGLESVVHIPNGAMFAIGTLSTIRAMSWLLPWVGLPAGSTVSADGATPKEHII
jgi:hypothetical protein